MTNTIKTQAELNEMKVTEIREYAKENLSPITGAWKMKKQDLIEKILEQQPQPEPEKNTKSVEDILVEIDVERKKPKKQAQEKNKSLPSQEKPSYFLLDDEGQEVFSSMVKLDVVKFAIENNICNAGWINRSIKTGEKIYIDGKSGKNTRPKNSKYAGVGYSVSVR